MVPFSKESGGTGIHIHINSKLLHMPASCPSPEFIHTFKKGAWKYTKNDETIKMGSIYEFKDFLEG